MTNLTRSIFQAHPFHLVSPSPWPIFIAELQTNCFLKNNPKLIFFKSFSTSISLYKPEDDNLSHSDSKITSTNERSTSNRDLADLYERYNDNPAWRDNLQENVGSNTNREDSDIASSSEKSSLSDFEEERDKFFSNDPSTSDTEELCDRFKDDEEGLHNYMENKRSSVNELAGRIIQFHNRELEKKEIGDKDHTELIQEVEAQRSSREQEINETDEIIKQTNFPDMYDNIEQESNTGMLRELYLSHNNEMEGTSSQESYQDADMEDVDMEDVGMKDLSEASPERNTESYVPSSARSEGESDINMNDNLSSNDNNPGNRRGGGSSVGSIGGSGGPAESSSTNNSLNRSVIDFIIETESCTSIFDDWEFFDIL